MRLFLATVWLMLSAATLFSAAIPGTVILNKITLGDDSITNKSIGDTVEMKGTPKQVANTAARDDIPAARRTEGMECWVIDVGLAYRLVGGILNANWVEISVGSGSGTFDFAALTNKPPPILLVSTNQGSSLSNLNASALASGTVAAARIDTAMATDAEVTAATAEAALEAVIDLQDLQGAVTDAQVPNNITVDLATTATTANAGDSATAFFSSGVLEPDRLASGTGLQVLRRNSGNTSLEFATIAVGSGDMVAANNLSDVANAGTSRTNLVTHNATNVTIGTFADARLSGNVSLLGQTIVPGEIDLSSLPDTQLLFNDAGEIGTLPQSTFLTPTGDGSQLTGIVGSGGTALAAGSPHHIISDNAYYSNNLNTVGIAKNTLVTHSNKQYAAFYNSDLNLVIATRDLLGSGAVTTSVLTNVPDADDEHDVASIAFDRDGYLHVLWGMHANPLNYMRSVNPGDTTNFADATMVSGETTVTYPMWIVRPSDGELYATFRIGSAGNGIQRFYRYNTTNQTWAAATGSGPNGAIIESGTTVFSAYLNGLPKWDAAGDLWWSFSPFGNVSGLASNQYLMRWSGTSFFKYTGSAQTIPATLANLTPIVTIPDSALLSVQNDFAVTTNGIYIPYSKLDTNGLMQQFVAYNPSGGAFVERQITRHGENARGYGIAQPTVIYKSGVAYAIFPDNLSRNRGIKLVQSTDSFVTTTESYLIPTYTPHLGINLDPTRFRDYGVAALLYQHADDPAYGAVYVNKNTPTRGRLSIFEWTPDTDATYPQATETDLYVSSVTASNVSIGGGVTLGGPVIVQATGTNGVAIIGLRGSTNFGFAAPTTTSIDVIVNGVTEHSLATLGRHYMNSDSAEIIMGVTAPGISLRNRLLADVTLLDVSGNAGSLLRLNTHASVGQFDRGIYFSGGAYLNAVGSWKYTTTNMAYAAMNDSFWGAGSFFVGNAIGGTVGATASDLNRFMINGSGSVGIGGNIINPAFSGAKMFVNATNGYVGIGTVSPGATLHVIGDVVSSGIFVGDGSGLTNVSGGSGSTEAVAPGQNTSIRTNSGVFNVDVTGTLTNSTTGNATTATTAAEGDSATAFFAAGELEPDRLASGTGLQVLRRNSGNTSLEFATIAVGSGDMLAANNLSDVASVGTSRTNLVSHNAANLTIGTLADARLSASVSLLGQTIVPGEIDLSSLPDTQLLFNDAGEIGTLPQSTFLTPTGAGGAVTLDASGFDGNLTTADNTLQEVAQKVDDLAVVGGSATNAVNVLKENGVQIGDADITALDFLGADFDLSESPDREINVVIAAAIARDAEVAAAYQPQATNSQFSNSWLRATSTTTAQWSRDGGGLTNVTATEIDLSALNDTELLFNNAGALDTLPQSTFAASATTLTIAGTANEIASSAGAQSLAANRTWTISLPATIDLSGKTSLAIPGSAAPTVDAFGEIAGDNNLWAAGRGAPVFYDGTAAVALVGALVSDAPSNGQVPTWNTGGTITWETPSGGGADADAIHDNVAGEIAAVADKATPVAADHLLIEDSESADAKKDVTVGSLEAALEGVMDLQDLQGAVTDAQVPDAITVNLATLASTVTVADGTDATSFVGIFDSATGSLAAKTDGALLYDASSGLLTATTLAGAGGGLTLDASGFNGNLTTGDNTIQEVAQKLDDLVGGGGVFPLTVNTLIATNFTGGLNRGLELMTDTGADNFIGLQFIVDSTLARIYMDNSVLHFDSFGAGDPVFNQGLTITEGLLVAGLDGTGSRAVIADAAGQLSAPATFSIDAANIGSLTITNFYTLLTNKVLVTDGNGKIVSGGAAIVTNVLTATASLDFGNILAAASADLTITVTGAKANDAVSLGLPTAPDASITYNGFVSSANTVTVRAFNVGAIAVDPASATYRAMVTQF